MKAGQLVSGTGCARDLRTYERSLLPCCAGSEVYTNQRACIIELEVIPRCGRFSGCLDSFNLVRRVAVCSS